MMQTNPDDRLGQYSSARSMSDQNDEISQEMPICRATFAVLHAVELDLIDKNLVELNQLIQ